MIRQAMIAVLAASAVLHGTTALAQQVSSGEDDDMVLEVITVTAQRREQNLIDVPLSLSVLSGDVLAQQGITSTAEIVALVPNLNFPDGGTRSYTRPVIRGVGEGVNNGTDSSVGVYLDDVPLPTFLSDFDLIDVERVEVLRGPQGTLFGQNSLSGAINIITRRPGNEFDSGFEIGYGSFDDFDVQGYVAGPVADGVRAKLVGRYNDFGGFIDNTAVGGKIDPHEAIALRGVVSFDLGEQATLDVVADYNDDDGSYVNAVPLNEYEKFEPAGNFSVRDNLGIAAKLNFAAEGFDLISITSYREFTNDDFLTTSGFANGFFNDQSQWSQEIRLSSANDEGMSWLVGLYAYDENFTQVQTNVLEPILRLAFDGEGDTRTYAAFGDITVPVTSRLDLTAGVRYTDISKEGVVNTSLFSNFAPGVLPPVDVAFENVNDIGFGRASVRASILYRLADNVSLFGSFANGFRPGNFSFYSVQPNDPSVDEEVGQNYEIGIRGVAFDGRLSFDVTGFILEYEDRITLEAVPGTGGAVSRLTNAGEATSRGIEASLAASLTDAFSVTAALAVLDTEFDEFVTTSADLTGNEFGFAPGLTLNLGWDYSVPVTDSIDAFIRGNWRYVDEHFLDDENVFVQESYSLVRLSVGANIGRFVVSLDVNNLLDEYYTYVQSTIPGVPGIVATPGMPRAYMGRVRFQY